MNRAVWVVALVVVGCGGRAGSEARRDGGGDDASILECTGPSDCDAGEICVANVCLPASCNDEVVSGNESDIDCGGDCAPCTEGQQCNEARDCTSLFCNGFGNCADCTTHSDCVAAPGTYCSMGACVDQFDDGASCDEQEQCESGVCESEGVCCDISCNGNCSTGTCDSLRADGISCSTGGQCLSGVCESEGVCCDKACTADCSSGTCTLYSNGNSCTNNNQCQSSICDQEDDVCCNSACNADCSTGSCILFSDGEACVAASQCENNVCAWEDVCCDGTCDGECEDGSCQQIAVFTNKSTNNCTTNLANPISYSASIQACVKGLRPKGTGQALGWASVGNVSCPVSGYTEFDTNPDWTYNATTNVWTSPLSWIPEPPYDHTPACPAGQLCFTTCYKNKSASGAVHRVYNVID